MSRLEVTITRDRNGLDSLSLLLTSVSNLKRSPQSSVRAAISGHLVTMATPGHRAAGACSGISLSPLPFSLCVPPSRLCLHFQFMEFLSFSLFVLCPNAESPVSSHLPRRASPSINPSISYSFVSFMCHPVCSPVCQETILRLGGGKLAAPSLMCSAQLPNISKLCAGIFARFR